MNLLRLFARSKTGQDVMRPEGPKRYQLPANVTRSVDTSAGEVFLVTAIGYYRGSAIFVYLPESRPYSQEMADELHRLYGVYMDPAPGAGNGGDECPTADAIITAGLDYKAYMRGERSTYHNLSDAPRLDVVACFFKGYIDPPTEETIWRS